MLTVLSFKTVSLKRLTLRHSTTHWSLVAEISGVMSDAKHWCVGHDGNMETSTATDTCLLSKYNVINPT